MGLDVSYVRISENIINEIIDGDFDWKHIHSISSQQTLFLEDSPDYQNVLVFMTRVHLIDSLIAGIGLDPSYDGIWSVPYLNDTLISTFAGKRKVSSTESDMVRFSYPSDLDEVVTVLSKLITDTEFLQTVDIGGELAQKALSHLAHFNQAAIKCREGVLVYFH